MLKEGHMCCNAIVTATLRPTSSHLHEDPQSSVQIHLATKHGKGHWRRTWTKSIGEQTECVKWCTPKSDSGEYCSCSYSHDSSQQVFVNALNLFCYVLLFYFVLLLIDTSLA